MNRDTEPVIYLGFTINVRETSLSILDKAGKIVYDGSMAFSSARRFIRGYRKASR